MDNGHIGQSGAMSEALERALDVDATKFGGLEGVSGESAAREDGGLERVGGEAVTSETVASEAVTSETAANAARGDLRGRGEMASGVTKQWENDFLPQNSPNRQASEAYSKEAGHLTDPNNLGHPESALTEAANKIGQVTEVEPWLGDVNRGALSSHPASEPKQRAVERMIEELKPDGPNFRLEDWYDRARTGADETREQGSVPRGDQIEQAPGAETITPGGGA